MKDIERIIFTQKISGLKRGIIMRKRILSLILVAVIALSTFTDVYATENDTATCKLVDYYSFMDMLHGEWKFTDAYNYFKNEIME